MNSHLGNDATQSSLSYEQLHKIEQQGSSAFYLLDLDKLKSNYQQLKQAFTQHYNNTIIAYSFKTNYAPKICEALKSLGCWAEVVSAMEYHIASCRVGFKPEHIIVNGPIHEPAFIEQALLDGALVNADGWVMLEQIAQLCAKHPQRDFSIGVRLNYDIDEGGYSRFGIDSTAENLQRLKSWEDSVENCHIRGFHSHFSASSRSLASFDSRLSGLMQANQQFFAGTAPQFINIGGGYFGDMPEPLAIQHGESLPAFEDYARLVGGHVNAHGYAERAVNLLLEPGTALVSNTMVFVCKVYDVKQVDGKTLALVNGSNHNINHKWGEIVLPARIVRRSSPESQPSPSRQPIELVGNTCIEKDVLHRELSGPVEAGDYVVFEYMGGYSNVLKQPFIHPCQPIYAWQDGELMTVKRQETVDDILATYT